MGAQARRLEGVESDPVGVGTGGEVAEVAHDAEAATDRYVYRAFGLQAHTTGNNDNPFTFVGQANYYRDNETDLYLLDARYYDPAAGRFVSEDPIGYKSGDVNLYRYVDNNPINLIDPTGKIIARGVNCRTWALTITAGVIFCWGGPPLSCTVGCMLSEFNAACLLCGTRTIWQLTGVTLDACIKGRVMLQGVRVCLCAGCVYC